MKKPPQLITRAFSFIAIAAIASLQLYPFTSVSADQIGERSLTLINSPSVDSDADGIPDGGSLAGGTVSHRYEFTLTDTVGSIGSIAFEYCTTAAPVPNGVQCDAPVGIDVTGAVVGDETGSGATGFTTLAPQTTANKVVISRAAAAAPSTPNLVYQLDNIINPSNKNETFFVRIAAYTSTDGTGSAIETGTVAASTAEAIKLDGTMPESLVFCTGETIGLTAGVPDCSTASDGMISFDRLFSPTDTALATSQMAASTNATQGYSITVSGPTLTSGSNTINAMAAPTNSNYGVSQFGLNVVENTGAATPTSPVVGSAIAPASNGTNYNAQPTADYGIADSYKYASGEAVADSSTLGTDSQIYTVSYIANVPGSQPAGSYATTLTYICTANF